MPGFGEIERVLNAYPAAGQPTRVEYLAAAGGLSGARFWRLETALGPLCLRRWPAEHPDRGRLEFIHQILTHAAARGFNKLPLPLATRGGDTWVCFENHFWQLEPWLPGIADWSSAPNPARLRAALTALAQFHLAVADFPLPEPRIAPAPGILRRRQQMAWWSDVGISQLEHQAATAGRGIAHEIIDLFHRTRAPVESLLAQAQTLAVPLTPCIRDIWHDNVLFIGDQVSGIVDFGASQVDNIAADVARLLGSLAVDDPAQWLAGIESYQDAGRLTTVEIRLVEAFDRANVLLSALNWMRWLYLDQRRFDNLDQVQARVQMQLARLKFLARKS
ncbi:MAG TPA: phosphotransferase [Pirellulales bacterium]